LAVYVIKRYFDVQELGSTRTRTIAVMTIATLISIGAGWAVDKLDGEAELHKNDQSITEIVKSGDPVKIAKLLVGLN
jgi:hypothetical protein